MITDLVLAAAYCCYNYRMKSPKGMSIGVGLAIGVAIGVATDNLITMMLLGLMFGIIGESANKQKKDK